MRKHAVLAAVVSLLIAVAVPAAIAATTVTPANGNDYILPDGSVYQQNDDGTYSWIPNVATGNAMGLDWNNLQPVDQLDGAVVDPIASVVTLSNASFNRVGGSSSTTSGVKVTPSNGDDYVLPNQQVYQSNPDGTYSWIPDVATGNAMHIDWNALIEVDELPGPVGIPFPHVGG